MCGIAGICNLDANWHQYIQRMNDIMENRGPDGAGVWNEGNLLAFGHRRLAIVDLSDSGAQPMLSHDGKWAMVLNGEIYNYKQLREELASEYPDTQWRSTTDTEVLLTAVEKWGIARTLESIRGMYAVAIYNRHEQRLTLFRDRMGEKPLYYGYVGDSFVFASDLRAILTIPGCSKEIDLDAVDLYFRYGYIPTPYSILKDFRKLQQGEILTLDFPFMEYRSEKYWEVSPPCTKKRTKESFEVCSRELESMLCKVIGEQLQADVPVGILLSGGIDSSTIAALASVTSSQPIHTFSIGFQNSKQDEAIFAKEIANVIGSIHHELYLTQENIITYIQKATRSYPEPFANYSGVPYLAVSEFAKKNVKVLLTGDGGDELFGGYVYHKTSERLWNVIKKTPKPFRKLAVALGRSGFIKKEVQRSELSWFNSNSLKEFYLSRRFDADEGSYFTKTEIPKHDYLDCSEIEEFTSAAEYFLYKDQRGCITDCSCSRADSAGMNYGVEIRTPMLDRQIVEYSWILPVSYKLNERDFNQSKRILRSILYRHVDKELMNRPKMPFHMPIQDWLRGGDLRKWGEDILNSGALERIEGFELDRLWKDWNAYVDGGNYKAEIWLAIALGDWIRVNL